MKKIIIATLAFLAATLSLCAQITLPTVLSDHMILQREQPVPVWGSAEAGSTITVQFAGQKKTATADSNGKWRVNLDPMNASTEPQKMTITSSAGSNVIIRDVLIGEVWLCSGQSNMMWSMNSSENPEPAIAAANRTFIRLYKTPLAFSRTPTERIDSNWTECTPETVRLFSAVAYYFGSKLQEELNVPVGLLLSAWGGAQIEPWTPSCGYEGFESLTSIRKQIDNFPADYGTDPEKMRKERQHPTAMYNAMLHANIPFAIKGAIWYQGESNNNDGMLYVDKTAALLKGWRGLWGYDFPFYFVQITPYQYGEKSPLVLPEFWEAQAAIVDQIPQTGMAVAHDATTLNGIHPPNKKVPGTRLALLALNKTYGKDVACIGPTFKEMKKVQGNKLEIIFDFAEGLSTRDGMAPDFFEIVGEDGIFKPAQAVIQGSSVILSSPEVGSPAAMRFAWHKLATPNLMNAAGLPAPAFRAGEVPGPKQPDLPEIPEMNGFDIVYQLVIPDRCNFDEQPPEYAVDKSAKTRAFKQVAYLLELQKEGGEITYAFAAMDAFTADLKKIGVPTAASGAKFMQKVSNLTVRSNVAGIKLVTDSDGGNIEFWPGNYSPNNVSQLPGASDPLYDFSDFGCDKIPGFGCMQVHNWKGEQTVFAFNRWNFSGEMGIGNSDSDKRSRDWTFTGNIESYTFRRLTVLVK